MICPVEIAGDVSALRVARAGDHAEHVLLHEGRDGAGDESTGRDFTSHGHHQSTGSVEFVNRRFRYGTRSCFREFNSIL
jgi:hypothetical protein